MDERQNLLNVLDSLENAFDDDPFTPADAPSPATAEPPAPVAPREEGPAPIEAAPVDDEPDAPLVRAAIGDDFAATRRKHQDAPPRPSGFVPIRMSTAAYLEHLYRMENL